MGSSGLIIHRYSVPCALTWDIIITGMRNSWESWEKGDSEYQESDVWHDEWFALGDNDKALAKRLTKIGDDHGKYLRQLPIAMDISAPEYWWKEFDTYKIGTTANSTSMMHTLGKHPFDESMFCFDGVHHGTEKFLIGFLNTVRDVWIASGKRKPSPEWRALLQVVPNSWIYRRAVTLNYQVLRNMYKVRKHHRLQEWRDFCAWIETLPHSDLITVENDVQKERRESKRD